MEICIINAAYLSQICLILASYMKQVWLWRHCLLCVFACPGFCFLANRNVTQWRPLPPLQSVGLAPLARLSATVQFISAIVPIIRTILLSGLLCCHGEIWRKPRKPENNPSALIALHLVLERSLFSSNEVCYGYGYAHLLFYRGNNSKSFSPFETVKMYYIWCSSFR